MSESLNSDAPPVLVRVDGLTKHFDVSKPWLNRIVEGLPRQTLKALDGVSLEIPTGSTFSLVGESGCGKSTLARCVVGLYRPTRGSIWIGGVNMSDVRGRAAMKPYRRRRQMIFQDPIASLNPRWRVRDIIAEPLRAYRLLDNATAIRHRVDELLRLVRLTPSDGGLYPHQFSGGQRQRISIARALASDAEFLVCDEPTSALDVSVQAQILNLMKDLQEELGLTYLFISHNLAVVYNFTDRVGVMYLGRLVECGDAEVVFRRPLHPYTRLLLDTVPNLTPSDRERLPVAGEVPSPISPPSGCHFHPRCPLATERCARESPVLRETGGVSVACHAVDERRMMIGP